MDLKKGFHQNVVKEDCRKFLRIICHPGIHEYLKIPFGIKNAPDSFQRMIDSEFYQELRAGCLVAFIDDIFILHDNW